MSSVIIISPFLACWLHPGVKKIAGVSAEKGMQPTGTYPPLWGIEQLAHYNQMFSTMKNKTLFLLVLLLLARPPLAAAADQGWKLLFSLQADKSGSGLSRPAALYVDLQAERYYVIDSGHNRLVSFAKDGQLLKAFNAGGALEKPIAMIKKEDGRLLVIEKGKATLTEIDLKARAVVPHTLEDQGRTLYPQRLKVADKSLYIIDKARGGIVVLDQALAVSRRLSCPDCPAGYADFSLKGATVYALPQLGSEIHVFDGAGTLTEKISLKPPPEFPVAMALATDGSFFILERHTNSVAQYQADGRFGSRHLGAGQKEGRLSYPTEIQVDPWGRVCVVDEGNGRVSVFRP